MSADDPPRTPWRARRRAALLIAAALPFLLWPPFGAPLDGSFDSSWLWGVQVSAARGLAPGLLPAGPLAGWLQPRAVEGSTLTAAAGLQLVLRALWLVALLALAHARPRVGAWAGAAALWLGAALVARRWPDHELVLLVLALALPWTLGGAGRAARLGLVAAGALTGVAPWLKPSLALAAAGALAGAALAIAVRDRRAAARGALLAGGAAVAAATGLALVAFDRVEDLARWASAVPEVLAGYGAAMALDLGPTGTLAALGPPACCVAAAALALRRRSPVVAFWAAALLPLAAVTKYAWVRADVHALAAGAFAAGLLGLAAVVAPSGREAALGIALGAAALGFTLPHALERPGPDPFAPARLRSLDAIRNARSTLAPSAHAAELARSGSLRLRTLRQERLAGLAGRGGIDVVPWRLGWLAANRLGADWVPSPTLQLYQASTPRLEAMSAAHFASTGSPRRLLAHFDPVDGRHPLWEAPRVWREIAARYAPSPGAEAPLVLERRAQPRRWRERELGREALAWDEWRALPAVEPGEVLFGELDLEPTAWGRIRRALIRAEPVWIELDGPRRARRWRLVPEQARFGLALGETPRDLAQLGEWLAGSPARTGQRFRLRSPDAARYRPVTVRWVARRLEGDPGS